MKTATGACAPVYVHAHANSRCVVAVYYGSHDWRQTALLVHEFDAFSQIDAPLVLTDPPPPFPLPPSRLCRIILAFFFVFLSPFPRRVFVTGTLPSAPGLRALVGKARGGVQEGPAVGGEREGTEAMFFLFVVPSVPPSLEAQL